ncbi:hypothetical protein [Vibrio splendidus]|uniref:hypothetical protein n=1 Tax=Vibrio splendidus TaxID=29497 RepID=UPI000C84B46C|nr:hypothetical protein [Vibrio splendidus]PMG19437.1 hypothetical protein BCU95_21505 [Vibrio splendidus]
MKKSLLANKFQMHYYFGDDSHTMDALVRNRCEAEIIAILTEIAKTLDEKILIECEAHREGGLRDIWKLANANAGVLSVIVGIAAIAVPLLPISDSELERLQKEDLRLSIEERKLRVQKLKAEIKAGSVQTETVAEVAEVVNENYKVITRRSNLFKYLSTYNKVTKLGVNSLLPNGQETNPESEIARGNFRRFILSSNVLPVETVDEAIIEIVSPVLKRGNYKWKGIFDGEAISFSMKDQTFKQDVHDERISFQHGSSIKCALNIHSKLDEVGEVVTTGYSVETVLDNINGREINQTSQGLVYRHKRTLQKGQGDLFAS